MLGTVLTASDELLAEAPTSLRAPTEAMLLTQEAAVCKGNCLMAAEPENLPSANQQCPGLEQDVVLQCPGDSVDN